MFDDNAKSQSVVQSIYLIKESVVPSEKSVRDLRRSRLDENSFPLFMKILQAYTQYIDHLLVVLARKIPAIILDLTCRHRFEFPYAFSSFINIMFVRCLSQC